MTFPAKTFHIKSLSLPKGVSLVSTLFLWKMTLERSKWLHLTVRHCLLLCFNGHLSFIGDDHYLNIGFYLGIYNIYICTVWRQTDHSNIIQDYVKLMNTNVNSGASERSSHSLHSGTDGSPGLFRQNSALQARWGGLCLWGCGYLYLPTNWLPGKFDHLVTFPNEEPPSVSPALRSSCAVTLPLVFFTCKGVILMRGRSSISSLYPANSLSLGSY